MRYRVKREYVDWEDNVVDSDIIDDFDNYSDAIACADRLSLYGDDQICVVLVDARGFEFPIKKSI